MKVFSGLLFLSIFFIFPVHKKTFYSWYTMQKNSSPIWVLKKHKTKRWSILQRTFQEVLKTARKNEILNTKYIHRCILFQIVDVWKIRLVHISDWLICSNEPFSIPRSFEFVVDSELAPLLKFSHLMQT